MKWGTCSVLIMIRIEAAFAIEALRFLNVLYFPIFQMYVFLPIKLAFTQA